MAAKTCPALTALILARLAAMSAYDRARPMGYEDLCQTAYAWASRPGIARAHGLTPLELVNQKAAAAGLAPLERWPTGEPMKRAVEKLVAEGKLVTSQQYK